MTTKRFANPLGHDLEAFLAHKRSLGRYSNRREELRLQSFDRFVAEHARGKRAVDVQNVVTRWLAREEGRRLRTVESELTSSRS